MLKKDIQLKIIKEIKEMVNLPEKGVVAGQAVASLVYKHMNIDLPVIINDIDLFVRVEKPLWGQLFMENKVLIENNASDPGNLIPRSGYGYKIVSSKKDKMLNTIEIIEKVNMEKFKFYDEYYKKIIENDLNPIDYSILSNEMLKTIVESFDLNCCSIGFDIETNVFYWTDSFETFLKEKKLKATSCHTPTQTLLRIRKKNKELNLNNDLFEEERMLLLYFSLIERRMNQVAGEVYCNRLNNDKCDTKELISLEEWKDNYENPERKYKKIKLTEKANEIYNLKDEVDLYKVEDGNIRFLFLSPKSFVFYYNVIKKTNYLNKETSDYINDIISRKRKTKQKEDAFYKNNKNKVFDGLKEEDDDFEIEILKLLLLNKSLQNFDFDGVEKIKSLLKINTNILFTIFRKIKYIKIEDLKKIAEKILKLDDYNRKKITRLLSLEIIDINELNNDNDENVCDKLLKTLKAEQPEVCKIYEDEAKEGLDILSEYKNFIMNKPNAKFKYFIIKYKNKKLGFFKEHNQVNEEYVMVVEPTLVYAGFNGYIGANPLFHETKGKIFCHKNWRMLNCLNIRDNESELLKVKKIKNAFEYIYLEFLFFKNKMILEENKKEVLREEFLYSCKTLNVYFKRTINEKIIYMLKNNQ